MAQIGKMIRGAQAPKIFFVGVGPQAPTYLLHWVLYYIFHYHRVQNVLVIHQIELYWALIMHVGGHAVNRYLNFYFLIQNA